MSTLENWIDREAAYVRAQDDLIIRPWRAGKTTDVNNEEKTMALVTKDGPASEQPISKEATQQTPIMRYFSFGHLPEGGLRLTSIKCYELAQYMDVMLPNGAEKSAGLRKLLEAKDCFVRAALPTK